MELKTERIQEKWYIFTRYHCKEGHLDKWMGDSINDPNRESKSQWQLNSFACFWRCDDGEWLSDSELGRSEIFALMQHGNEFTAKEIWNELLKREQARRQI